MTTNFERAHSRWLDPPEPPTHSKCNRCGDLMDYGDMDEIDGEYYCEMCADIVRMEEESDEA